MKILICHERFIFRFGVDRVLLLLAREFRRRGHRVTLLGHRIDEGATGMADRVVLLPDPEPYIDFDLLTLRWLERNWDREFPSAEVPDVVLVGGWPFFASISFFEERGCPVVYSDHGITPDDGLTEGTRRTLALLRELKAMFVPRASGLVAVSRFILESQSVRCLRDFRRASVILNGVDHSGQDCWGMVGSSADPTPPAEGFRLLCLGRFEPRTYKQSERVFAIEALVRRFAPDAWIGVLACPEEVEAAAPGRTQVVGIGHPSDAEMYAHISSADATVCFSGWEGFNLPLAEAQALGRPCLVFDVGAHREVVANPWMICRDETEMAEKLRSLFERTAPQSILDGSDFAKYSAARPWADAARQYLEAFERARTVSVERASEWPFRRDRLMLVDVTNSCCDPANSGVIRVARRLAAELQRYFGILFVVWDRGHGSFRFPTAAEFDQLSAYDGPRRPVGHPCSWPQKTFLLADWLRPEAPGDGWLLIPEIRHEQDLRPILRQAAAWSLRTAAIFHDAIPLLRPDLVTDPTYRDGHAAYMRALGTCDVCVANSHYSAECLARFWQSEGIVGRVVACPLPGGFPGRRPDPVALVARGEYKRILCVSTVEPRKNHRRLVDAFLRLSVAGKCPGWELILVGNRYAGAPELANWLEATCRVHENVHWLGIVSDDNLRSLYEECSFTVYASEIEGFGLPILESVWYGRPCLCHSDGVMAELAADGGCLTVDVMNASDFEAGLDRMINDPVLRNRLALEAQCRPVKRWSDFCAELLAQLALVRRVHLALPWTDGPTGDPSPAGPSEELEMDTDGLVVRGLLASRKPRVSIIISENRRLVRDVAAESETVFWLGGKSGRFDMGDARVKSLPGNVSTVLSSLLIEIEAAAAPLEFVYAEAGAVGPLLTPILRFIPQCECHVLVAGSAAESTAGDWHRSPYVQSVLDLSGRRSANGNGNGSKIWLACLSPTPRKVPLTGMS